PPRTSQLRLGGPTLPAAAKAGKLAHRISHGHSTAMHALTAAGKIGHWLAQFERALGAGNAPQKLSLVQTHCFWTDTGAFTLNSKTREGQCEIATLLAATLAPARAVNFRIEAEARESDDGAEARFTFETNVCQGRGHLRLKDGKCYTLLTTATALKGHEEKA